MDKIRIEGGRPLNGVIPIGGAKNAALPLMAAALLSDEPLTLANMPHLADIVSMAELLAQLGVDIAMDGSAPDGGADGRVMRLSARAFDAAEAPYELVRKMRASVLVLGPLLARRGRARVSLPGGCAIGARPVDLHLSAMEALGATIALDAGYVEATAPPGGLRGAVIRFPSVSVGATENAMMAAALADGESVIENAAREPEIADLAACLSSMGAKITGAGESAIRIEGVPKLGAATHRVLPDRIEAGSFAVAAAMTGGDVTLKGARLADIGALIDALSRAHVKIAETEDGLSIARNGSLHGVDVMTEPFPGFATDMQAQFMALMTQADGAAMITETIFENRFMHVPELARMGADVTVHGASALVRGGRPLKGAPVMATDLRASVSLVLAGLAAEGETTISRVYHLDRGYERLEEKLARCGAAIERVRD
ncbi:MAG: UDP-N-acetylglucosamine 1-carboxyvinyltransferase [Pseudomonadota bacterium]